jgi:CHAT domain-containing protein
MNSIAQSFLNGGASSVITSLWLVDDRTTAEFMNIFYYYLSKGFPKNKALQFTKKKMMNQAPYYWAPFILIGDSGNI